MENPLKIREELMSAASPAARKQYIEGMRKYFIGLLSHKELAIIVRSALGPHTGIHNRFIRAIFTNAEHKALVEHYGPQYTKDRKPEPASRQPASTAGQKPPDGPPLQSTVSVVSAASPPPCGKLARGHFSPQGLVSVSGAGRRVQAPPTPVTPMKTMWSGASMMRAAALRAATLRTAAVVFNRQVVDVCAVKYPALGNGPPQIQTSLAGGITDLVRYHSLGT